MKRKPKVTMVVTSPEGYVSKVRLPVAVAFAAARGIHRDTHSAADLVGPKGTALFYPDGSGKVKWNDGQISNFGVNGSVSIY